MGNFILVLKGFSYVELRTQTDPVLFIEKTHNKTIYILLKKNILRGRTGGITYVYIQVSFIVIC